MLGRIRTTALFKRGTPIKAPPELPPELPILRNLGSVLDRFVQKEPPLPQAYLDVVLTTVRSILTKHKADCPGWTTHLLTHWKQISALSPPATCLDEIEAICNQLWTSYNNPTKANPLTLSIPTEKRISRLAIDQFGNALQKISQEIEVNIVSFKGQKKSEKTMESLAMASHDFEVLQGVRVQLTTALSLEEATGLLNQTILVCLPYTQEILRFEFQRLLETSVDATFRPIPIGISSLQFIQEARVRGDYEKEADIDLFLKKLTPIDQRLLHH